MKHPGHVCGGVHTLRLIILRLLCFRQKVTIVTYQIPKMVLERIQQDTPKTFWIVTDTGLQTYKCSVPPASGNCFFCAALCPVSGFLLSFLPVFLSQFLFSAARLWHGLLPPSLSLAVSLSAHTLSGYKPWPYQNSTSKSLGCADWNAHLSVAPSRKREVFSTVPLRVRNVLTTLTHSRSYWTLYFPKPVYPREHASILIKHHGHLSADICQFTYHASTVLMCLWF